MTETGRYFKSIINQGAREAQLDNSTTIEAQHLLLAIAAEQEPVTHQVLTSAGLDRLGIRQALNQEFEHNLNTAGVSTVTFDLPPASRAGTLPSRMGTSAKLALERSLACVARRKDLQPAHLLLGILQAQVGTVPRALALAGINRTELMTRIAQILSSGNR